MEPLFFKAENLAALLSVIFWAYRFNGAAFFQSGKPVTAGWADFLCAKPLQWSRFFSKRKTDFPHLLKFKLRQLQWSRFFSERKTRAESRPIGRGRRFNGAAFFQSGKRGDCLCSRRSADGFNGAAFFQSGKRFSLP